MAYLYSLPKEAHLSDLFKNFPLGVKPLLKYHDEILRKEGPIKIKDRELIAAYVSALNQCRFCFKSHVKISEAFGVKSSLIEELLIDIHNAGIEQTLKPIFEYVKKLTLTPFRIVNSDLDKIYAAGWDESAINLAANICALFNLMNRIVLGLGISEDSVDLNQNSDRRHLSKTAYTDFGRRIGV